MIFYKRKEYIKMKTNQIEKLENADILKLMRKEKNVTQKELAKRLNVSQGAISQYENGQTDLSIKQIMKICEALDQPFENWLIISLGMVAKEMNQGNANNIEVGILDKTIIDKAQSLNDNGKQKAIDYMDDLAQMPKYKK